MSAAKLIKRFDSAKTNGANWRDLYEECFRYAAPQRNTFNRTSEGEERSGKGDIYDSTPQSALSKFVSNMKGSMVPDGAKWASLRAGVSVPEEPRIELQSGLDYAIELFFANIKNSNFDTESSRSFYDLAVGQGALLFNEGDIRQPFEFVSVPLSQLYTEAGANGDITAVFREHKVPVRAIKDTWPEATLTETQKAALENKPETKYNFIETTTKGKIKVKKKVPTENDRVKLVEVEIDGYVYQVIDVASKSIVVKREIETNPWIIFRWDVLAGESNGRGPLTYALPDIKSLEKVKELTLKNASLAVAGAWTVQDDGIINIENISIEPGAVIPVAYNQGSINGATIAPLQTGGDFNVGDFVTKDLRQSINDMLFAEPLGAVDAPVKTATEIATRQQALAKRIGSTFGRLQRELIVPLIERGLDILVRKGLLDSDKISIDGNIVDIEYETPIATAAKNEDLMNIQRFMETIVGIFGPQVALAAIKPEMLQYLAEKLNIPVDLLRSTEEVEKIGKQVVQQQQGGVPNEGV